MSVKPKQVGALAVAVPFLALALADGGYSLELRSALTMLLWVGVMAGLATGVMPRGPVPTPALLAGCLLAGLALLTVASMAWASDDGAAFDELVRVFGYLGLFALIVCSSAPGSARIWLVGLAIGIAAIAVLAVGSRLIPGLPGDDEQLASFLPAAGGRLSWPIGYWNALAGLMAVGVTLAAWLGSEARTREWRAAAAAAIPAFGLVIYLASSRGGAAAALAGVCVLAALSESRTRLLAGIAIGGVGAGLVILFASRQTELLDALTGAEDQGRTVLLVLAVVTAAVWLVRYLADHALERIAVPPATGRAVALAAGAVVLAALVVADPAERWDDFKAPPDEAAQTEPGYVASHFASSSGSGRYQYWSEAIDAFEEEPLHGIGAGAYASYWQGHAPITQTTQDAHSLFAETLGELGPLGLLLVLGLLAMGPLGLRWGRVSARAPEAAAALAVLAAVTVSAGIDIAWEIPAAFAPAVLAIALLTGPAMRPGGGVAAESRFGWGLATLAVGWIALVAAADSFLTQRSLEQSQESAGSTEYAEAADRARDAVALQPWSGEPRLQLALVYESAAELARAREEIGEAIERAEDDWLVWFAKARIETRSGRLEEARDALSRARELNPTAPFLQAAPEGQPDAP